MYRISHINIKNFRESKEVNLTFADDNVTIIYGSNGSGKTTLLKIIHGILDFNKTILESEKITDATIVLIDTKTNVRNFINVTYSEDSNEYEWSTDFEDFEAFYENYSSIVFGVNRGITNTTVGKVTPLDVQRMLRHFNLAFLGENNRKKERSVRTVEDLADFLNHQVTMRARRVRRNKMDIDFDKKHIMLDNLSMNHVGDSLYGRYLSEKHYISERVQKALFETLAQVLDSQQNSKKISESTSSEFLKKLAIYQETLIEVLSELEDNELSNKLIQILSNYNPSLDIKGTNPFEGKELMSHLVYNMIIELEKGKGMLNSVSQLVEHFNSYLSPNKKLVVDEDGAKIETPKSSHGIEKLSSGERHLLSFLTLFIIEGRGRSILMIDEPEISLNLTWQSKLLKLLTEFVPNSQIIVATHSPAIGEYNTNNLVEIEE
ncbi:ATP-binding protein [Bacillus cereus]|uniref:AAA family ATPase n=1 Tax=Bacillus cereus TaxID=1396 RepID=UPI00119D9ADE|nr:AAA family ATPase [Bacillus cereus]MDE7542859.1 ATP-binding protein [Bacillus cereus]